MYLTRHQCADGPRWALDHRLLPADVTLAVLLRLPLSSLAGHLRALPPGAAPAGTLVAPVESTTEIWAAGVTYERSREAREAESAVSDVYARVYDAERPELFWKAVGWRAVGHQMPIRIRGDSRWNVPEPELTLVINAGLEIVGYCVGNDVSSRDIEGANPLYLPQAKTYDGSCALGPGIVLSSADELRDLQIRMTITRAGGAVFAGETSTSQMKRSFEELVGFLSRELALPQGALLMTGTGIVPPPDFSMRAGDRVSITIGPLTLENHVDPRPRVQEPPCH
jgi:2-dehydro-3-deoxy-D-arabinonate dehydratase